MKVTFTAVSLSFDGEPRHRIGSLTVGRNYLVLAIMQDHLTLKYQVVTDEDMPVIYEAQKFVIADGTIPAGWIFQTYKKSSGWVITPAKFAKPGFWEDFFNGDGASKAIYEEVLTDLSK